MFGYFLDIYFQKIIYKINFMDKLLSISTFIYLLTVWMFVISLATKRRYIDSISRVLFIIAGAVELIYFIWRWTESYRLGFGHIPLTNAFESFVFFTLSIAFVTCIFIKKVPSLVMLIISLVILGVLSYLSISPFNKEIEPLIPALRSNWLTVHALTSFLSYAAFFLAFIGGVMLLMKSNEKRGSFFIGNLSFSICVGLMLDFLLMKVWHIKSIVFIILFFVFSVIVFLLVFLNRHKLQSLIPQEEVLKNFTLTSVYIGVPFLSIGIVTGSVWAKYAWGAYWSWDPKETWSLITWFVYVAFLHLEIRKKSNYTLAVMSIAGFIAVIITYIGVNFILPGLHSYGSA